MTTLYDLALRVADICDIVTRGTATGGSTTTLADTLRTAPDDHFKLGTLFIESGTHAGKFLEVTDYTTNTHAFAALGSAIAAGVQYAAITGDLPLHQIIAAINSALTDVGIIMMRDDTLVTVADQLEYDLPAGVFNLRRVEVSTDDTAEEFVTKYRWREIDSKIVFDKEYTPTEDGLTIRLTYKTAHESVSDAADAINDLLNPEWLSWCAAVPCLRYLKARFTERKYNDLYTEALQRTTLKRPTKNINIVKLA